MLKRVVEKKGEPVPGYTFSMKIGWPGSFTSDTKIQLLILIVLIVTLIYGMANDAVKVFFGRKRLKFVSLESDKHPGTNTHERDWTRVGVYLSNPGPQTFHSREVIFETRQGKSGKAWNPIQELRKGQDHTFIGDILGSLIEIDDFIAIRVIDSLNNSYIGYIHKGRFVPKIYGWGLSIWRNLGL